tara:strand:+ start:191 stop:430 length:240 start_codon:yes stop_codon:yes gene_type:complete
MGCCTQEDQNMSTGWKDQGATGAGTDGMNDADLAAALMDANAGLSQTMILNFEGIKLPDMDSGRSKSDAFAVLFEIKKG